ncbi:alkaline shock response membrane anchor protein AmaP [Tepidibacillus fermentans]|uniref:Putative alkaline shock family protein YloU n=1 Tax=Tepidibacillus fermentans TaxID=1281767 RepID=A0A4R3KK09_9BACI|nr:alkaline shock response membrane anchor protein AmaP [Tepidibacillus fermentans]TCS84034.1 putative alkaline shock family protein YloU [Tepidibacillus fermentans]
MKLFDRLILFLSNLSLFFITLFIIVFGIGLFDPLLFNQLITRFFVDSDVKTTVLVISVLLFLISLYLMAKSLQRKEVSPISKHSEIGDIKISMETLENLVIKITSRIKGVRELKAKVKPDDNGSMTVLVKIVFDGETPIPQITKEIQDLVKERLEQITGITVGQVHVMVSNVSQSTNKKVLME